MAQATMTLTYRDREFEINVTDAGEICEPAEWTASIVELVPLRDERHPWEGGSIYHDTNSQAIAHAVQTIVETVDDDIYGAR